MHDIRATAEVRALIGADKLRELDEDANERYECWQCGRTPLCQTARQSWCSPTRFPGRSSSRMALRRSANHRGRRRRDEDRCRARFLHRNIASERNGSFAEAKLARPGVGRAVAA